MLFIIVLLIVVWLAISGDFSLANFGFGAIISLVLVALAERTMPSQIARNAAASRGQRLRRLYKITRLLAFFVKELFVASFTVLLTVLFPAQRLRPGVIAIPLDVTTDAQITLLGNLITLTPGTLTLDVSTDKTVIFVHSIYVKDPDSFRREIKDGFEQRILEVTT